MLVHVHLLVNGQQHCSCVYRRSNMCLLECNVCGGITAVVLSRCRSLYLWISLDLHGILAIGWTPAYSVLSICVCWPPKRRIYHITSSLLHIKYVLPLCCLLKVSQYQLTLIDTASVHIVNGISQRIHSSVGRLLILNLGWERLSRSILTAFRFLLEFRNPFLTFVYFIPEGFFYL